MFSDNATQQPSRRIITFEFGKHIDTYFCNLEGHSSPNLLKMILKNSGFRRNCYTGCPKKSSVTDLSDFLDWKHDHKLWFWLKQKFSIYLTLQRQISWQFHGYFRFCDRFWHWINLNLIWTFWKGKNDSNDGNFVYKVLGDPLITFLC